jgi:Txe/YoeB family toxin of Txe-Axe toxin-antitoxin module
VLMSKDEYDSLVETSYLALAGAWSRRTDEANRFVYIADERYVTVLQARYHH